ncbi:MAG TPA: STAS domain-containing protein [Blastocatellia bacterium]|nr:STAS domain-containing protein [Blastocatellia bacterium]
MEISVKEDSAATIIQIKGDIDLYSSPKVRQTILNCVKSDNLGKILVDMTGVAYIDSSGVASLIEGLQLSNQRKRTFGIFGLSQRARAVIELARLDKVFKIFTTEAEALGA